MRELEQQTTEDFGFRFIGGIHAVAPFSDEEIPSFSYNLLAWDNVNGVFAIAGPTELYINSVKNLNDYLSKTFNGASDVSDDNDDQDSDEDNNVKNMVSVPGGVRLKVDSITNLIFTSDYSKLLLSIGEKLYYIDNFQQPKLNELFFFENEIDIVKNCPSHGNIITVLDIENHLFILDITIPENKKLLCSDVSAFDWSPKGKQLVVGLKKTGELKTLTPKGDLKKTISKSSELDPIFYPISITWLSTNDFFVYFNKSKNHDDAQDTKQVVISSANYIEAFDITPAFSDIPRKATYYPALLHNWSKQFPLVLFLASASSTEISALTPSAQFAQLNDTDRAQLPLNEDTFVDAIPIGFAIDLTNTEKVYEPCNGVDVCNPLPRIVVLTHDGQLVFWNVFESHGIKNGDADLKGPLEFVLNNFNAAKETLSLDFSANTDSRQAISSITDNTKNELPNPFASIKPNPVFGNSTTASSDATAQNPFSSNTGSPFDTLKTNVNDNNNGKNETKPSAFGSLNSSPFSNFKSSNEKNNNNSFGSSPFNSLNTNNKNNESQTKAPAFGSSGLLGSAASNAAPAFGSSGMFGSSNSNSSPAFGSSGTFGKTFGNADFGSSAFGMNNNKNQSSFGSSTFGSNNKNSGFGSFAKSAESPFASLNNDKNSQKTDSPLLSSNKTNSESPFASFNNDKNNQKTDSPFASLNNDKNNQKTDSPFASFNNDKNNQKTDSPFASLNNDKNNQKTDSSLLSSNKTNSESPFASLNQSSGKGKSLFDTNSSSFANTSNPAFSLTSKSTPVGAVNDLDELDAEELSPSENSELEDEEDIRQESSLQTQEPQISFGSLSLDKDQENKTAKVKTQPTAPAVSFGSSLKSTGPTMFGTTSSSGANGFGASGFGSSGNTTNAFSFSSDNNGKSLTSFGNVSSSGFGSFSGSNPFSQLTSGKSNVFGHNNDNELKSHDFNGGSLFGSKLPEEEQKNSNGGLPHSKDFLNGQSTDGDETNEKVQDDVNGTTQNEKDSDDNEGSFDKASESFTLIDAPADKEALESPASSENNEKPPEPEIKQSIIQEREPVAEEEEENSSTTPSSDSYSNVETPEHRISGDEEPIYGNENIASKEKLFNMETQKDEMNHQNDFKETQQSLATNGVKSKTKSEPSVADSKISNNLISSQSGATNESLQSITSDINSMDIKSGSTHTPESAQAVQKTTEDLKIQNFENDELYLNRINEPKTIPNYVRLGKVRYPSLSSNPVERSLEQLYYNTAAQIEIVEKNIANIGEYITDQSTLRPKHTKISLPFPSYWKLGEAGTIQAIIGENQSELTPILQKFQALELSTNQLVDQLQPAFDKLHDIRDIILKIHEIEQKSELVKYRSLDFDSMLLQKKFRTNLNNFEKLIGILESKLLILKSKINLDELLKKPENFEVLLLHIKSLVKRHYQNIKDLNMELQSLNERKLVKAQEEEILSEKKKSINNSLIKVQVSNASTRMITKLKIGEALAHRPIDQITSIRHV
ncbi:hypothetical protein PACTADRAFT_35494 [Pachysolen tannophilus NRRL Y-2460]|uniref:Nucleoporin Nup159/Nup146 N-terminal domain-containing protein n=1 Tax=Pachysolen tannophilus NRRL Y-2460 TaxID=669874 RepID=A0A1E4TPQ7_PACTA|nr:hypothetical protein PACTADRAFT_35494 [Pachysolen tannophilus NRRL Y-2460]